MTKPIFILILFVSSLRITYAQLAPEKISENMQEAEEYILSEEYNEALNILTGLIERGHENANIDYKAGFCYLQSVSEKPKAFTLLKRASEKISSTYSSANPLEENAPVEALLYLGDAYRIQNDLSAATKCYIQYAERAGNSRAKEISDKRVKECQIARVLQSRPVEAKFEILPEVVNQGLANLNPVASADGNSLVFTRKMKFYDAIFFSKKANGTWQEATNITTQLGSDGEFYPSALSADGTRLLLTSYNALSGQDIYESTWNGSRWTKLKKLGVGVNSKYYEVSASYSPDGKTILFASNRENSLGGYDIYKSELNADGVWSQAINLGSLVNTPADEKKPHLLDNGRLLIFSSEGHLCMGGYDLFYTDYPVQAGSKVKNVGYPLSTVLNDLSFYPLLSENVGYLAKHDDNVAGESGIFRAQFAKLSRLFQVNVKVPMEVTGLSSGDSIWLFMVDAALNDTIDKKNAQGNPGTLNYQLYPGNFKLIAQNKEGKSQSTIISVSENLESEVMQVPLTVLAFKDPEPLPISQPVERKDTFIIHNVMFGFNSNIIDPKFEPLLDKVAATLAKNPAILLTITGYTDNLGEKTYNHRLSGRRAETILQYLVKKGVEAKRLTAVGAGNTNFIAVNSSPESRKYNRRVEFTFENMPSGIVVVNVNDVPEKLKLK